MYITSGSHLDKSLETRSKLYHLILLAENQTGYQNLMKLVSIGEVEGFYYKPRIDKEVLRQYSEGLICLSACIAGEVPRHILRGELETAEKTMLEYLDIFGRDNYFLEIQNHGLPEEATVRQELHRLAKKHNIRLVATTTFTISTRKTPPARTSSCASRPTPGTWTLSGCGSTTIPTT